MSQLFVEGWSPEYGSPLEQDDALAPAEGSVDVGVERSEWEPLQGADDGLETIAFVDGARRVDARLTLDEPAGPVPGICGTFAVGAVIWDRPGRRSNVDAVRIERWAVLSGGRSEQMPPVDLEPPYQTTTTPDDDPLALVKELQSKMRRAEGETASRLSSDCFVVADGPLYDLSPTQTIGYIKSHRVSYLPDPQNATIGALAAGQRTPLFTISDYKRYSWYLRLAVVPGGHTWTGIVRCEASGAHPLAEVVAMADRSAAVLPLVCSEEHIDPRAPQNLVPIAALERDLHHRMGDRGLVYRALRAGVMRQAS